ncbi:hypothetical protein [Harryflintia acetispora]|uniref:hypothetical protein n=1 Tax=Harryflintia acetispora TaxID=1849041 RepID=UPI0018970BD9|nr:hypothetical protein [Harryflintia acetispora]
MKKLMGTVVAVLGALLVLVPSGAAGDGVTVTVQDGYSCDYGINIPFTRTGRSDSYTFEIYAGETAAGAPEVRAEVEVHADSPVTVFLPLRYDVTGPSTHTLKVTAHVLPGREAFDREGIVLKTFDTTPSCGCAAGTAGAFYAGGGSEGSPYRVGTAAQLAHIQKHLKSHIRQTTNITLSGSWTSLGDFAGVFDGGGYQISGLSSSTGGLFSKVYQGEVKNLNLVSPKIVANGITHIGAVCNLADQSSFSDCTVLGASITCTGNGYTYQGGLLGYSQQSTLTRCKTTGSLSGRVTASTYSDLTQGGMIGSCQSTVLNGCLSGITFGGTVAVGGYYAGGMIGAAAYPVDVKMIGCHWERPARAGTYWDGATVGDFNYNSNGSYGNSQVSSIEGLS